MNAPTGSRGLAGKLVRVHFNLRSHRWSITAVDGPRRGRVIATVDDVALADARLTVSAAGAWRARRLGRRTVHAWATGTVLALDTHPSPAGLTRVSYRPRPKDHGGIDPYFRVITPVGRPGPIITTAPWLLLAKTSPGGSHGYAWIQPGGLPS